MKQIFGHRRESRRKQRKQTWFYGHGSLLPTREVGSAVKIKSKKMAFCMRGK